MVSEITGNWTVYLIFVLSQMAKILGSTSIRYRSDAKVLDRCLIDVDPIVFAILDLVNGMASEITGNSAVCSIDSFGLHQRKYQSSKLLALYEKNPSVTAGGGGLHSQKDSNISKKKILWF